MIHTQPAQPNGLELLRQHYSQRVNAPLDNWHGFWLKRCLELAIAGLGCVAPNPLVGAILVRPRKFSLVDYIHKMESLCIGQVSEFANWQQYFEILGQGYHVASGQLHAEAAAFVDASNNGYRAKDFQQAVLYCNLEPCSFHSANKKQPPCCEQIIDRQVGAVVFANHDPNPKVEGAIILHRAGVLVRSGDFARQSAIINQIFFHSMADTKDLANATQSPKRPWVSLKLAQSLDGCIATKSGHSQWISGPAARAMVQALRASHGAVCSGVTIGRKTLEADNPSLLLRPEFLQQLAIIKHLEGKTRQCLASQQPWRVVWDSNLHSYKYNDTCPLQFYQGPHAQRSIIICNQTPDTTQVNQFTTIVLNSPLHSRAGLYEGLAILGQTPYNIQHLLLEGGSQLASSFLAAHLVDEVYCFVSQRFIGNGLHSLAELQPSQKIVTLPQTLQLQYSSSMPIVEQDYKNWNGPDEILCHGYLNYIFIP